MNGHEVVSLVIFAVAVGGIIRLVYGPFTSRRSDASGNSAADAPGMYGGCDGAGQGPFHGWGSSDDVGGGFDGGGGD